MGICDNLEAVEEVLVAYDEVILIYYASVTLILPLALFRLHMLLCILLLETQPVHD